MPPRPDPDFHYDGYGDKARIGLIFMASSVVMEAEMYAMAAQGVSIHTSRITLPKVTVAGIEEMMASPELEQAARLASAAPIDVLCFGGTSASFLHGTAWDRQLSAKLDAWSGGITPTTASTATLAALDEVAPSGPVALATPYRDEITQRAARWLGENGHKVLSHAGLDITSDHALAEVPPERVYDLAREVDVPEAEAVFISCTNLRTVGVLEALETVLEKPVVSAVQASLWHCLHLVGVDDGAKSGYGSLLDGLAAS